MLGFGFGLGVGFGFGLGLGLGLGLGIVLGVRQWALAIRRLEKRSVDWIYSGRGFWVQL